MSQVLEVPTEMGTPPLRRRTESIAATETMIGRIHLEERPWAAVAFKGEVPVLRKQLHVVAAYSATDCAATEWICPPLPNLPSFHFES